MPTKKIDFDEKQRFVDVDRIDRSCSLSGDVGVENKRIDPSSSIPVGFARGRVKKRAKNIA